MNGVDNMEDVEEDVDENDLLNDLLHEDGQDLELTRLTEMVRKQYLKYLERQLHENLINSYLSKSENGMQNQNDESLYQIPIKRTAELLEDKAVKACMVAKFYQRAMVKIIAIVRRSTQERKLIHQLSKCIHSKAETSSKATQTDVNVFKTKQTIETNPEVPKLNDVSNEHTMSLDEKIEIFQKHLQREKSLEVVKKCSLLKTNDELRKTKRHYNYRSHSSHHRHYKQTKERNFKSNEPDFSPTPSTLQSKNPTSPAVKLQTSPINTTSKVNSESNVVVVEENSNDSVALELARLFSEEKTELDEIFGIDPNEEPDDPQICKILKEIEEAKINHVNTENLPLVSSKPITENKFENPTDTITMEGNYLDKNCLNSFSTVDLSKSIWPCELFMQRRTLSESLSRLLEEDLRWHDIMKWKFVQLFGEDSDDEFTPCSPSIELDEVLIGSCIRRISPWIVKELMKPMRDGLIGNRFLFKKLAKQLAHSIIMENQYPDEVIIKNYVENFFCLYQAVMSLEDLDVDMPSISSCK